MQIIGRSDRVDFPELGLEDIESKIDSGAYTSVIHCDQIHAYYKNGEHRVSFLVYSNDAPLKREANVHASREIRNSFGETEYRYTIKTPVVLFGKNYLIELALANRSKMKYPVLLGRKLIGDRFVIDVSKTNLSYRQKRKKKKQVE